MRRKTLRDTFWFHVERTASGCLEWQRTRIRDGYGHVAHGGRLVLAHRLAYEMTYGAIPDGMCVLHSCDNPPCCNPEHLSLGTHQQNMKERDERRDPYHLTRDTGNGRALYSTMQIDALLLAYDALPRGPRGALANGLRAALLAEHGATSRVLDYALKCRKLAANPS